MRSRALRRITPGLVCPKGAWKVVELEEIIEDEEDARLSKPARELLLVMVEHLHE